MDAYTCGYYQCIWCNCIFDAGISDAFNISCCLEYSVVFVWAQEAGKDIYGICYLCGLYLFCVCMAYLEAKGGYSNKNKTMIYFVVNRYQVVRMKEMVHQIDAQAYITISEVADVFSNNNR